MICRNCGHSAALGDNNRVYHLKRRKSPITGYKWSEYAILCDKDGCECNKPENVGHKYKKKK